MRSYKVLLILAGFILISVPAATQETITNPARPGGKAKNVSIRVANLTEVLRISDESGDFSFKNPRRIKIAPDGSVFIAEREQLFKFDSRGRFLKTFLKKGEGPGEIKYFANFFFTSQGVVIGSFMPVKLIFISLDGTYQKEFKLEKANPFLMLMNATDTRYYFHNNSLSFGNFGKLKTGINKRVHRVVYSNNKGNITEINLDFMTRDAVIKTTSKSGGVAINMDEITDFITAFDRNNYVYVVHNDRYMIKQVDLGTGKITLKFTRDYRPVDYQIKQDLEEEDARIEEIKNHKFFNDVYALRIYGGKLLVFTSTMDDKQQVLVDVFNHNGKYQDCFYLKIPGISRPDDLRRKPLCFDHGHFWTSSVDEDDNPVIIKFKMN
jgi:hypothetical protein